MKNTIFIFVVVIIVTVAGSFFYKPLTIYEPIEVVEVASQNIDTILTKLNVKFPHIVKAQIIIESANMTSNRTLYDNNVLGLKVAKQRPTTAINNSGHAIYNSIEDCIIDYALWQAQNAFNCKNEQDYFELLGRIYAEDKNYIRKLKQIINK